MSAHGSQDYKQRFYDNLKFYFDENKVLSKFNLEFVHRAWTINFEDNSSSISFKVKNLV